MMLKLFEKFQELDDVKNEILLKAIDTNNLDVIKTFIKKGYNINGDDVLLNATYVDEIFRFFLNKGIDVETYKDEHDFRDRMSDVYVQKALIDYDYGSLIYDTVGFDSTLKHDPKYANKIKMIEDVAKYNM